MIGETTLIAEPRDFPLLPLSKSEPGEIDIHLGELASGALQCLDELFSKKKIRLLEVIDLKRKCERLVELTKRTQKNTLRFEDIFASLTESGKRIASALRRRNDFPEGFDSKADNLRKKILRSSNDVMASNHNAESLSYQITTLEEEVKLLAKEAAMYPTIETLKSRRKEVERAIDTETVERKKYSLESRRLHRQLSDICQRRDQLVIELAECEKSIDSLTSEFNAIQAKPQETVQKVSQMETNLSDLKDVSYASEYEIKELTEKQSRLEQLKVDVETETTGLATKYNKLQNNLSDVTEKLSTVRHQSQELKNEEAQLNGAISKMKVDVIHLAEEKKRYLESTNQVVKSGATAMKLIRQGEKKLQRLQEAIKYLEETRKVRAADLELLKKMASRREVKESRRLRTQIFRMTEALLDQNELADHEKEEIRVLMKETTKLLAEIDKQKRSMIDLHRLVEMKSFEVSQKKRYLQKAQLHYVQVKRNLKLKQFYLNNYRKTLVSLQQRLQNLGKLNKGIGVERSECLTMINLAQQKKLMIEEKCCFYTNEMTILQSSLSNKQDQVYQVRRSVEGLRKARIVIRSELSKQTQLYQELESRKKWFSANLQRLNRELDEEKVQIGRIQDECKVAIQKRDSTKQQLEDTLAKLEQTKETLNKLEMNGRKSRDALSATTRKLALLFNESRADARTVEIIRSRVVQMGTVGKELTHINDQTSATRERLLHLEDLADDPRGDNSINRLRLLQGTNPSLEQLSRKENHLLSALVKKETKLREIHAVFKIVDDLINQSNTKLNKESARNIEVAKDVNSSYRINYLKEVEMRATCAELRMKILQSAVLKRHLEAMQAKRPEDRQVLQRRRGKSLPPLLRNKTDLTFYTAEVISQLSIHNIKNFFM